MATEWAPITGIIDPGEQPADAAAREALEEGSVVIAVDGLPEMSDDVRGRIATALTDGPARFSIASSPGFPVT